jgi:hypothetical protein
MACGSISIPKAMQWIRNRLLLIGVVASVGLISGALLGIIFSGITEGWQQLPFPDLSDPTNLPLEILAYDYFNEWVYIKTTAQVIYACRATSKVKVTTTDMHKQAQLPMSGSNQEIEHENSRAKMG